MSNLEYLEKMKKGDDDINKNIDKIANKDYPNNVGWAREIRLTFRKVKALEIIAEELINLNNNSGSIITTLENIQTILGRS